MGTISLGFIVKNNNSNNNDYNNSNNNNFLGIKMMEEYSIWLPRNGGMDPVFFFLGIY